MFLGQPKLTIPILPDFFVLLSLIILFTTVFDFVAIIQLYTFFNSRTG